MSDNFMPQIKNIVYLMLENRSFDNLLGWLYTPTPAWKCPSQPLNVYPPGSSPSFDGLVAGKYFNPDHSGKPQAIIPLSDAHYNGGHGIPESDPYEALRAPVLRTGDPWSWKGVMNQLFGNQHVIGGLPSASAGAPAMQGFFQDYHSIRDGLWFGQDILWAYTPNQANVINKLALTYAVSDRWFCSIPSQTNPNRAYSLCGTSAGWESNQNIFADQTYDLPTIFNAIGQNTKWGIYYSDIWKDGKCYTEYTFPSITPAQNGEIAGMGQFYARAKAGTLPAFTYLEPSWTTPYVTFGTDYHPDATINLGEQFLKNVYVALRSSPQWKDTLFVITFDEHGGTYDHVPPPWGAINPDGINGRENGFGFNLFGVRVPMLLVSPFVRPSTVFRAPENIGQGQFPFDHTSFIKTLFSWAGVDEGVWKSFGKRMLAAQTFEKVLAESRVNDEMPEFAVQTPEKVLPPTGADPVLEGLPVIPLRVISKVCKTPDEKRAAVELYRTDRAKFDLWLNENL